MTQQTGYVPQEGQFAGVPRSPFRLGHEMNLPIVNHQFCEPYQIELTVQNKCCNLSSEYFTTFDPTKKQGFRMYGRDFSFIRQTGFTRQETKLPSQKMGRVPWRRHGWIEEEMMGFQSNWVSPGPL
eukprot:Gb_23694 [translate_table: standard]